LFSRRYSGAIQALLRLFKGEATQQKKRSTINTQQQGIREQEEFVEPFTDSFTD
jgi:hypothetical protein